MDRVNSGDFTVNSLSVTELLESSVVQKLMFSSVYKRREEGNKGGRPRLLGFGSSQDRRTDSGRRETNRDSEIPLRVLPCYLVGDQSESFLVR